MGGKRKRNKAGKGETITKVVHTNSSATITVVIEESKTQQPKMAPLRDSNKAEMKAESHKFKVEKVERHFEDSSTGFGV